MRRLSVLLAALLVPAAQPLLLAAAIPISAIMLFQTPAQAQSAEAVAKVAQAITVRIEGATQGSGVLVKRDGNRYTVLTAWHVMSGQRPGEELDIYTPDGQRHKYEQGSIKRLGLVDMAVLSFSSPNTYELAKVGDVKSVSTGDQVLVAGFPVSSNGKLKYDTGKLVANAAVGIDQGYQLLYRNDTATGMSGGVVLKADGTLIGMHGRGEVDLKRSSGSQLAKTGINQGIPIRYYTLYVSGLAIAPEKSKPSSNDDFAAIAQAKLMSSTSTSNVINHSSSALKAGREAEYLYYEALKEYARTGCRGKARELFMKAANTRAWGLPGGGWRKDSREVMFYPHLYLGICDYQAGKIEMALFRFSNLRWNTDVTDPFHRLAALNYFRVAYGSGQRDKACWDFYYFLQEGYYASDDMTEYLRLCPTNGR